MSLYSLDKIEQELLPAITRIITNVSEDGMARGGNECYVVGANGKYLTQDMIYEHAQYIADAMNYYCSDVKTHEKEGQGGAILARAVFPSIMTHDETKLIIVADEEGRPSIQMNLAYKRMLLQYRKMMLEQIEKTYTPLRYYGDVSIKLTMTCDKTTVVPRLPDAVNMAIDLVIMSGIIRNDRQVVLIEPSVIRRLPRHTSETEIIVRKYNGKKNT